MAKKFAVELQESRFSLLKKGEFFRFKNKRKVYKFDGGGNTYKITVDIKAGVYTIVQQ